MYFSHRGLFDFLFGFLCVCVCVCDALATGSLVSHRVDDCMFLSIFCVLFWFVDIATVRYMYDLKYKAFFIIDAYAIILYNRSFLSY